MKRLQKYVDRILDAMGHPEALVTDESKVGDFTDRTVTDSEHVALILTEQLGIPVSRSEYIWQLAERLAAEEDST